MKIQKIQTSQVGSEHSGRNRGPKTMKKETLKMRGNKNREFTIKQVPNPKQIVLLPRYQRCMSVSHKHHFGMIIETVMVI